jgi:hypothetical protein
MAKSKTVSASFKLGWMDRFFAWVDRLPGPFFVFYLALYLAINLALHAFLWADGSRPIGELSPAFLFTLPFWACLQTAAFHYFQKQAQRSLIAFRPTLRLNESEFEQVKHSFVHLSSKGFLILSVISFVVSVIFFLSPQTLIPQEFQANSGTIVVTLGFLLLAPFSLGFFVFVFHSLIWINRLYAMIPKVNLFDQQPLYALSRYTSRVGMLFILYLVLNYLTGSAWGEQSAEAVTGFYLVLNGLIAVLAFLLPLWGVHIRLAQSKDQSISENNQLIEKRFAEIQTIVKSGKLAKLAHLRSGNAALIEYRQELSKISTWPWDTATVRTFLTALAVPMTVWLVQQVLLRTVVK